MIDNHLYRFLSPQLRPRRVIIDAAFGALSIPTHVVNQLRRQRRRRLKTEAGNAGVLETVPSQDSYIIYRNLSAPIDLNDSLCHLSFVHARGPPIRPTGRFRFAYLSHLFCRVAAAGDACSVMHGLSLTLCSCTTRTRPTTILLRNHDARTPSAFRLNPSPAGGRKEGRGMQRIARDPLLRLRNLQSFPVARSLTKPVARETRSILARALNVEIGALACSTDLIRGRCSWSRNSRTLFVPCGSTGTDLLTGRNRLQKISFFSLCCGMVKFLKVELYWMGRCNFSLH